MKTASAVLAAAVLLLAGCASTEGTTAPSTTTTGGTTSSPSASGTTSDAATTTSSAGTATSTTASAPVPTAVPTTFTDVNRTIDDTDLKTSIAVKRIARELPWPQGYKASAEAYELLAVEMTWTPSKDYTIPIRSQDFSVSSGSQFPGRPESLANDAVKAAGWALLPDSVDKGDPVTGWLVFKVDPRGAAKLTLDYNRPAVQITSGGSGSFPAKAFSLPLVG